MTTNMKQARNAKATSPAPEPVRHITKSVSMPADFWPLVEARIAAEADLDFSKLVRRLIRADLAGRFVNRAKA